MTESGEGGVIHHQTMKQVNENTGLRVLVLIFFSFKIIPAWRERERER